MKTNKHPLTKLFCTENNLLFLPKTQAESAALQRKLFAMGFRWEDGSRAVDSDSDILTYGFILENCELMMLENPPSHYSDVRDYPVCTLEQFDEEPLLTREEQVSLMKKLDTLTEMFTQLSAKVDSIYNEVKPRTLDKPGNKLPRT